MAFIAPSNPIPSPSTSKLKILHLGESIRYNIPLFKSLLPSTSYEIDQPPLVELARPEFIKALTEKRWGEFSALMRPFWNTGGEMGNWDEELISLLPKSCKVFASAGTGYDWADVEILAKHGIVYCNGATASTEAVADCFIWHLLSTFRNFTRSSACARRGPAEFLDSHKNLIPTSHNPRNHTLGIIGLGNIGSKIAEKSIAAFGMKILYTDVVRKSRKTEEELQATFYETLEEMVSQCDAVVLATPSLPNSSYLINAATLSHFKKGSRFINIARGSLVDSNALADALESGHLFAAGLDVFEDEPNVNERLVRMQNVELTCHNAGGAIETWIGFEELVIKNVEAVLTGKAPLTAVNSHLFPKTEEADEKPEVSGNDRGMQSKVSEVKIRQSGDRCLDFVFSPASLTS